MVISTFFVLDKNGRESFFEKSFLLANIKLYIIPGISFWTINNTDIDFQA